VLAVVAVVWILAFDLSFFRHGTYRPPVSDQGDYVANARMVLDRWGAALPLLPVLFPHAYGTRARPDPGGGDLVRALTFKGPGYPVFLAAAQLVTGAGPGRARLAQAALHAACALLVLALATRVASPAVGMAALAAFALYAPFTYMASQLLTENLCLVLLPAAALLGLRATSEARWRLPAAALLGLTLVALALTRPVYLPLSALLLACAAGLLLARWRASRDPRLPAAALLAVVAFGVPYLAWQTAMSHAAGGGTFYFQVSGPRTPHLTWPESYDLRNGGWPRPLALISPGGAAPFAPPAAASVRADPAGSLALRLEKLYRLWRGPATAYANPFGFPAWLVGPFHAALVLAAACGLFVLRGPPAWLFVALPVLYTSGVYTLYFSEERRFAFPVMPLVIVLAAVAAAWLVPRLRAAGSEGGRTRRGWVAGAWVLALALAGTWMGAFPGATPHPAVPAGAVHGVAVAVLVAALAAAALWLARGMGAPDRPWRARVALGGLAALVVLPVAVHLAGYRDWATWRMPLRGPGEMAAQAFRLPADLGPDRVRAAHLLLDVRDADGRLDDLEVRVNGRPQRALVRPRSMPAAFRRLTRAQAPLRPGLNWDTLDAVPGMRQWLTFPLDPAALGDPRGVWVVVRRTGSGGGATELFGEAASGDPRRYRGPRPWLPAALAASRTMVETGRNSYWRHQTYGDMRLHGGPLAGEAHGFRLTAASPKNPGDAPEPSRNSVDLSPDPLTQGGSYHIRLQLFTRDGEEIWL
jgi:hypothetical protein